VQQYEVPGNPCAFVHSIHVASDVTIWHTERNDNAIGKYDPKTRKSTRYPENRLGEKDTLVIDPYEKLWISGVPLTSFDPQTEKYTDFAEVPERYGIDIDWQENVCVALPGHIKSQRLTQILARSSNTRKSRPQRIRVAPNGLLWVTEYSGGKVASFDPKTEKLKEYQMPVRLQRPGRWRSIDGIPSGTRTYMECIRSANWIQPAAK
jgi:streptogramin lyase